MRRASSSNVEAIEGSDAILAMSPAELPSRCCAVCGSSVPGGRLVTSPVYYSSRWIYLLLFVNVIITFLVYLATRRRIDVSYYLCPKCAAHRTALHASVALALPGALVLLFVSAAAGSGVGIAAALALFIVSPLALMTRKARGPSARAFDETTGSFLLDGIHREVVDSLRDGRERRPGLPPYAAPLRPAALPPAPGQRPRARSVAVGPSGTDGGA